VLRPKEITFINANGSEMFSSMYRREDVFDVLDQIKSESVHGRPWLEFDAQFAVYRRKPLKRFDAGFGDAYSLYPISPMYIGTNPMMLVHAPGRIVVEIPQAAKAVTVAFGFQAGVETGDTKTDGAAFEVRWSDGGPDKILSYRELDPANEPTDRGLQSVQLDLPVSSRPAHLILKVNSGVTSAKDWTCWGKPEFK
jgi:hypothetical protein